MPCMHLPDDASLASLHFGVYRLAILWRAPVSVVAALSPKLNVVSTLGRAPPSVAVVRLDVSTASCSATVSPTTGSAHATCCCLAAGVLSHSRAALIAAPEHSTQFPHGVSASPLLNMALAHAVLSVNLTEMPSASIFVCCHDSEPYLKYPPV